MASSDARQLSNPQAGVESRPEIVPPPTLHQGALVAKGVSWSSTMKLGAACLAQPGDSRRVSVRADTTCHGQRAWPSSEVAAWTA